MPGPGVRRAAAWALAAVAAVLAWQALAVQFNFRGDWTALYYTGAGARLPEAVSQEDVYQVHDPRGYDGQYYHLIAHDPWMRRGYMAFVDNPGLRWRRILVPALARTMVFADDDRVDSAYFIEIALWAGLGVYWTSRFLEFSGLRAAWGLMFLLLPAVLTSVDRMTVDVALAALCAAFALYASTGERSKLYAVLALAPLARETGMALVAGYCLFLAVERAWRKAALFATAALPSLAWFAFVRARSGPDGTPWTSWLPLEGIIRRTLHPLQCAVTTRWLLEAAVLDYVALRGVWLALGVAAWWLARRRVSPLTCAAWVCAAGALWLANPDIWAEAYSFTRTQTPLLMLLAFAAVAMRRWEGLAPMLLAAPRVWFQLATQWHGILHGLRRLV